MAVHTNLPTCSLWHDSQLFQWSSHSNQVHLTLVCIQGEISHIDNSLHILSEQIYQRHIKPPLTVCNFRGCFKTKLWYWGRSQIGSYLVGVFVSVPVYDDWASQCLACESPKYLSCHSDSSVRLCLSVSWLAWELSMVGVEGQVFPVFLFFVLSSFRFFFVCANMYVNFIEHRSVGHCMFFCVSGVLFASTYSNYPWEDKKSQQSELHGIKEVCHHLKLLRARTYCMWIIAFTQHCDV